MSSLGRKRSKRTAKIVTYEDDNVAQEHASYERVSVVTKSGAVKHRRVEQNLAPKTIPHTVASQAGLMLGNEDDTYNEQPLFPDDVLAGVALPRYKKPRKVDICNNHLHITSSQSPLDTGRLHPPMGLSCGTFAGCHAEPRSSSRGAKSLPRLYRQQLGRLAMC